MHGEILTFLLAFVSLIENSVEEYWSVTDYVHLQAMSQIRLQVTQLTQPSKVEEMQHT